MGKELIECSHCEELKKKEAFGHSIYYAVVCFECQKKHGLCADCGGPRLVANGVEFACTGWHGPLPMLHHLLSKCPTCGHKF